MTGWNPNTQTGGSADRNYRWVESIRSQGLDEMRNQFPLGEDNGSLTFVSFLVRSSSAICLDSTWSLLEANVTVARFGVAGLGYQDPPSESLTHSSFRVFRADATTLYLDCEP